MPTRYSLALIVSSGDWLLNDSHCRFERCQYAQHKTAFYMGQPAGHFPKRKSTHPHARPIFSWKRCGRKSGITPSPLSAYAARRFCCRNRGVKNRFGLNSRREVTRGWPLKALPWCRSGGATSFPCCLSPVPVANQIRTYLLCSPPRIGRQRIRPALSTVRDRGASLSKDRCVRVSL
jgi:hypothetical protein